MKLVSLLLALGSALSAASGQRMGTMTQSMASVRLGFDPNEVVRRARPVGSKPIFDDDEFLIDTGGAYVPALDNQSQPAVAFDGTNYLVVWSDSGSAGACSIYGARVTPEGKVLDPVGFVVSPATLNPFRPAVAFDGTNFLVVWETNSNYDIYEIGRAHV
jgi:hypothetical protein